MLYNEAHMARFTRQRRAQTRSQRPVAPSRGLWTVAWWQALIAFLVIFGFGAFSTQQGWLESGHGTAIDSATFRKAEQLIQDKAVNRPTPEDLSTGAIKGLVSGLGDPYSDFLTKDEAEALNQSLAGTVDGIGIEIGERNGQIQVIAPVPDSPAARAGIAAGDVVLAVGDQSVAGQSVSDVANQIRGPKGSEVTVTVQTPGQAPRPLKIIRQTITTPSLKVTAKDGVAVVTVSRFGDDTTAELDKQIDTIKRIGPRGIVLDLRGNPGGYLEEAVSLTSRFQPDGVVVKEKFRDSEKEETVSGTAPLAGLPLVVLVDKGSASASEITAGSLRDNRKVLLVGEQTFGKGSVQELEELDGGAVLKLTIAEWFTPNGTSISKEGLKPDVSVSSDTPDAQLQAAIDRVGR